MKRKRDKIVRNVLAAVVAGAILTAALGLPTYASPIPVPTATVDPEIDIGSGTPDKTTVGIAVSQANPQVLSVEVPLYVTVAVTNNTDSTGTAEFIAPTESYEIKNGTYNPDGSIADVGVTGMSVSGVGTGGLWSIVATVNNTSTDKQLSMSIGGIPLPAINAASTTAEPANIKVAGSPFYDLASGKFLPVDKTGKGQKLAITGDISEAYSISDSVAAAPQFRLKYTIALLDQNGHPIGVTATDTP